MPNQKPMDAMQRAERLCLGFFSCSDECELKTIELTKQIAAELESFAEEKSKDIAVRLRGQCYTKAAEQDIRRAVLQERTACAKVAGMSKNAAGLSIMGPETACDLIAERILARGEA